MNSLKKNISILINKILSIINLRLIYKNDHIFNHNAFELENINISKSYSMTGEKRMSHLTKCIKYIHKNNISGDLVECGVWRGGNLILMKRLIDHFGLNKNIYGYDTFEGMSPASEYDINIENEKASKLLNNEKKIENLGAKNIWCFSGIDTVRENLVKHTNNNNLTLIKGDVSDTLRNDKNIPKSISLLRLDTDFYESTKVELEVLFPKLEKGGVLIIDDYGHFKGARKAVDEYFGDRKIWLKYVDYTCRLYVKE